MREKKSFFTKNNSLNKGGKHQRANDQHNSESKLLELFNTSSPDAKRKFLEHIQESNNSNPINPVSNVVANSLARISTFLFILFFTITLYFGYDLLKNDLIKEAVIFCIIAFSFLLVIIYKISSMSKKNKERKYIKERHFQKKPKSFRHNK